MSTCTDCLPVAVSKRTTERLRLTASVWLSGVNANAGQLVLDPERCQPDLTYWPLLPGDVIVLCTDGLVEEGAFLSPADLTELIDDAPAAALVERLVSAALARHRDASEAEPEGCGDDVTERGPRPDLSLRQ